VSAVNERTEPSRANEQRRRVVNESAILFDRVGYHNASMEDIALAVGLAKPTLYHYFKSKDEILFWIHEEFIDLMVSRHNERLGTPLTPEERLFAIAKDTLELMETHRGHMRVFFEHSRELSEENQEKIRAKITESRAIVEEQIRLGIEAGTMRPVDPRLAMRAFVGMCVWAYQWWDEESGRTPDEVARTFWDLFIHGIQSS
jgi:TetR/AcrR family transcriptional regulator, cholesterol catabolism regulator